MSHIFEALQRAEQERSGETSQQPPESVVELLQTADLLQTAESISVAASVETLEIPEESFVTRPGLEAEGVTRGFISAKMLTPAPNEKSRLVCLTDQGSLGAEKFRVLGLRLRQLRERRKLKRIVVTSTIPSEGKSLIAANLALNQARSKVLKTVLIDGDLRRPTLTTLFGFHRSLPGLCECLREERRLKDVVYKLKDTGLWFLPAGLTPENPIELMQSGHLKELLEELEAFFDWIIIDTPPILPLADSPLWTKFSDGTLMVVREGVSEKRALERAVEMMDSSTLLGLIVNGCSRNELKYYYSRYGETNKVNEEPLEPTAARNEANFSL